MQQGVNSTIDIGDLAEQLKDIEIRDEDVLAARSVFEQFLLDTSYLNQSAEGMVRLRNTFIEVQEDDKFGKFQTLRSSTCPPDFSEELLQFARTWSKDLPLMASLVESSSPSGMGEIRPAETPLSSSAFTVTTPTMVDAPQVAVDDESQYTTVMLRNIPNKYTQSSLLEAIDVKKFKGLYNFFYLPVDFKNGCNMGYAFINFVSNSVAELFISTFKGFQLPAKSTKVCDACWARVQGLFANVEHYRNSPVNDLPDPEYRPLLFENGVQVAFPRPDAASRVRSNTRRSPKSTSPESIQFMTPRTLSGSSKSAAPQWFAESDAAVKFFIGGLGGSTTSEDLRVHFAKFGPVLDAAVVSDKKTGVSRGFGFCSFMTKEAGDAVMKQRQHIISGHSVGVRLYQPGK